MWPWLRATHRYCDLLAEAEGALPAVQEVEQ